MTDGAVRSGGLIITLTYALLIGWLFIRQPATMAEVAGSLSGAIGAYRINQQDFAEGLRFFHNDQFAEARAAFARADPARRDERTQFYVAYSYHRQGWGRLYHDDALYQEGLETIDRAIAAAPAGRIVVDDDPGLQMTTADELRVEFENGLRRDVSDFNPLRVLRERR